MLSLSGKQNLLTSTKSIQKVSNNSQKNTDILGKFKKLTYYFYYYTIEVI